MMLHHNLEGGRRREAGLEGAAALRASGQGMLGFALLLFPGALLDHSGLVPPVPLPASRPFFNSAARRLGAITALFTPKNAGQQPRGPGVRCGVGL